MRRLEKLTIKNFKSIREQSLALGPLNLFIGGNGAGKSNLVQVFGLLKEIINRKLGDFSRVRGADSLLYFGRKESALIQIHLEFGEGATSNSYSVSLQPRLNDDALFVSAETAYYHEKARYSRPWSKDIAPQEGESGLKAVNHMVRDQVMRDLESYRIYHFEDTSSTAAVKHPGAVDDNQFLREDASNLGAFLHYLQAQHPNVLRNIEDTVRQIAPFFERFQLEPSRINPDRIRLEWREKGSDAYFNAHALSDGTLRFICLATLLMQPDLPSVVLLDEPELGLHPAAILLLASLLRKAAQRTQVLVATQSVGLVGQFTPEEVWAVEREDRQSVFKHLAKADLDQWLEGYSLGELWEMNRLGARP